MAPFSTFYAVFTSFTAAYAPFSWTWVDRICKLVFDLTASRDGIVDPKHASRYKELGDFVRKCYGTLLPSQFPCSNTNCTLTLTSTQLVDRVVIREDLRNSSAATS
ncbi:unnamed protein product [Rotaria magnacalcarata]|uniref:Uncharacterized protein n=1 Tax=Rotaria magnacalcarata TaxID=392030 RepID=A0A816LTJ9_9BILA|nr:unnamed protein product [Rotaria magnacalcarata]CAF1589680.1 unnamed protein product [Rotaria magnacalcarata]CAF1971610.1 unnamed protein product [Rotaria magnacalcarata]CAF2035041.1 unnamed protein product [Rotaria magnacalcarata]CAF3862109.1 unnamed protein product [Rotaria magnacalcarata]